MTATGSRCPFMRGKPCMKHDCAIYTRVQGTNRNTGQPVDEWGCAINWLPVLLIEATSETKMTTAAVTDFREHVVNQNQLMQQLRSGKLRLIQSGGG